MKPLLKGQQRRVFERLEEARDTGVVVVDGLTHICLDGEVHTAQLSDVACGPEGLRSVRTLRRKGHRIAGRPCRDFGCREWLYRLVDIDEKEADEDQLSFWPEDDID